MSQAGTAYETALQSVEALTAEDQRRLLAEVANRLGADKSSTDAKPRSILEIQGLGKDIWQDVDVDDYLKKERSSWNG